MHMKIVKIDLVQIQEIYDNYLVNDFIVDEVKPFDEIKRMYLDNKYEGYAYYDDNVLIAYAFIAFDDDIALLDYFACIYRLYFDIWCISLHTRLYLFFSLLIYQKMSSHQK